MGDGFLGFLRRPAACAATQAVLGPAPAARFTPPHTSHPCSSGGVVVTTADSSIVCSNTLDERLEIVYSQNLPSIRTVLFGEAN